MPKTKILFLCTGNSCRSQMAEGWARELKSDVVEAHSAGVEKHGMNEHAVASMARAGVDISGQQSKIVDELPHKNFDYVVTLCGHAAGHCPSFPGTATMVHRGFDDPPKLAREANSDEEAQAVYDRVRDAIRAFVAGLPDNLPAKEESLTPPKMF